MQFDLNNDFNKKVHFIGIGGVSMSGLAEILLLRGYKVSGSDMKSSPLTEKLSKSGADIYIGHDKNNLKDVDIVVYTAAIPSTNPEIIESKALNIQMLTRAQFLGAIMKDHKYNVAVSGTHGKTTTTSMIAHITLSENLDPTILVGGELDVIGGNVKTGKSEYFITEACEYKASFLSFYPYIGVVLNIDADHLDFYKDINAIQDAFEKFTNLIPKDGYLVSNADDERTAAVAKKVSCNVLSFGIENGDIRAKNIEFNDLACASFDAYNKDKFLFRINLSVPGKHNVLNALGAIASSLILNISAESIIIGLKNFGGTHRRFEYKGIKDGVVVIDDYAHHPTEIKATLAAVKNYPHKRVFCVFQPHTYSRTLSLFNEFTTAFSGIDELIIADIYAAREKDTGVVSSQMLAEAIKSNGIKCNNIHNFKDIVTYLHENLKYGDLLLTVGAGDVFQIGEDFLNS